MPKLCLFDASGYLHRAFHAIPPLNNSKGEPVNAIFGFTRMISKVLKEDNPDYIGVCFDTASPTFRHTEYKEYKATRTETDSSLIFQLPLAEKLAQAWGLPCLKKDGYEADDVIATLAMLAKKENVDVVILSGDKDMLQLVQDGIVVRDEVKKVEYNAARVNERYGIGPHQLVDLLSLTGDKVDNVTGVPGVGEKTAAKLMAAYGSLEGIFENADKEKPALRDKLLSHKDTLLRNRSLINLKTDVPLNVSLEGLKKKKPDEPTLTDLLKRFEFRGGLHGIEEESYQPVLAPNENRQVTTVLTEHSLHLLEEELAAADRISYDLETDDLNKFRCQLVGVSLSTKENTAWYIPVGHRDLESPPQLPWEKVKRVIGPPLENPRIFKCGQNVKFDNAVLARFGIHVADPVFDTMVAAYCLDPGRSSYGLKDLAAEILKEGMTRISELIGKGKEQRTFAEVPIHQAAPYAGADSEVTLRLSKLLGDQLAAEKLKPLFDDLEMPLVRIIQEMETAGISIDAEYLKAVGEKFTEKGKAIEKEIFELAGETFVLNSPKQLAHVLFEKLKLPASKKTKTGYSTDEEVLKKLAFDNPICEKIIAARELGKLSSTYVDSILEAIDPQSGRVHTTFNQTGTITGRFSSSSPNLQNIPIRTENGREIRRAFVAPKGSVLVSADYSQIDLRSLAHMSEDPVLIRTFQAGGDIHATTAAEIFHVTLDNVTADMRRSAKAINFGIVYGQQAYALSQSLGIPMDQAKEFISNYFEKYAGVRGWIESTLAKARRDGFVATLSGRRRQIPDISSPNAFTRGFAERVAINTPIQGTSADIIKYAMIRVGRDLRKSNSKTRLLVQVHDELLFEVPESELTPSILLVQKGMEEAFQLRVPLVADIKTGPNWNDMKKVQLERVA